MKIYQKVIATFKPARTDDLINEAEHLIGFKGEFIASWIIEDGPYTGQWAMATPREFKDAIWVPLCDLEIDDEAATGTLQ